MSDKRYEQLAARLNSLIDRPQFAGRTWNWVTIGQALDIPVPTAQRLVQWMRRNTTDIVWTVGTYTTDYQIIPTKSTRDALAGIINQLKHLITRLQTAHNMAKTLSVVDPDPRLSRFMGRHARFWERSILDVQDQLELLQDLFAEAPPDSGAQIDVA